MQTLLRILLITFLPLTVTACVWDAQSLSREKSRNYDLAQTILHNDPIAENTNELRATIKSLEANRQENDVDWWNNLAGSYIRLSQSEMAVKLLEPVVKKFPNDYGIHANLGTAYHLLGRYQDAEHEIARDLEINPDAHFGLEKYHLALLQYLVRDSKYQARHVYVDECTAPFLVSRYGHFDPHFYDGMFDGKAGDYTNNFERAERDYRSALQTNQDKTVARQMLAVMALMDSAPAYRTNWDLLDGANFEGGVIYMAQMNPKDPACFTMLGIAAWKKLNYHLAAIAFDKAISLGSPQAELLKERATDIRQWIQESASRRRELYGFIAILVLVPTISIVWFTRYRLRYSK
ncbi:MAG TPA: tetratricopeptide repeat protein [Verrucomicrobiae bacterium]|jgi:tetratricopeptide (TPR) repeat protein|nr:tetratricopeptide repeat protein [Verrucomicrobiae bacterium]